MVGDFLFCLVIRKERVTLALKRLPHYHHCLMKNLASIFGEVLQEAPSYIMNELSDTFQELVKDPNAKTPAAPSHAHLLLRTMKSGCPTPVSIGKRRAADLNPSMSNPQTITSRTVGECRLREMRPKPSSKSNDLHEPSKRSSWSPVSVTRMELPSRRSSVTERPSPTVITLPSFLLSTWVPFVSSESAAKY